MTATLSPSRQSATSSPRTQSRWSRWTAGWRVALRLARREAWRSKGRSLLVISLIALPVAAASSLDLYTRAEQSANSPTATALGQLGSRADALVSGFSGAVTQGITGSPFSTSDGSVPTLAQLQAQLPPGTRLVAQGSQVSTVIERDGWGVIGAVWMSDVTDPLVAGLWRLRDGRLPAGPNEIALTKNSARRLRTHIGDTVTLTPVQDSQRGQVSTVVGLVDESSPGGVGIVMPGSLPMSISTDTPRPTYLASIPRDLTWTDVRRLNSIGGLVISRSVILDPPSFCNVNLECGDSAPRPGAYESGPTVNAADLAKNAALSAVVAILVILQVALLAGPAFAVSLRRRQRELGLIGAVGGDSHDLRRTMLASGVVLGITGGLVGLLVGLVGTWVGGLTHVLDLGFQDFRMPSPPPELLGLLLVSVISAVAAAVAPAVSAGRGDVVDALQGRRPLPPISRRVPIGGIAMGLVGLAGMYYGTATLEPVILAISTVIAELGLILVMPALVTALARMSRYFPLAPRLAIRDAGRHRMRTTAAACAIAAAAAGSVAVSALAMSNAVDRTSADVPWVDGTILSVPFDLTTGASPGQETLSKAIKVASASVPGATIAEMTELMPVPATDPYGGDLICVMPGERLQDGSTDAPCQGRGTSGSKSFNSSIALIRDPTALPAVLGPLAPNDAAIKALESGKALVMTPGTLDEQGRLTLRERLADEQGFPKIGQFFQIPAMEISSGAIPINVIVGPAALSTGSPLSGHVRESFTTIVVTPNKQDQPDRPTVEDTLNLAWAKAGLAGFQANAWRGTEDTTSLVLALAAGVTALLALLAALMATGLALADGRADLATLAAVGAPPRIRRTIAASSAGFVSLVGCTTGAFTGLIASRLLVPLFTKAQGSVFVTPWMMLAVSIIAIPVVVSAIAWLLTRSRVTMTRRIG